MPSWTLFSQSHPASGAPSRTEVDLAGPGWSVRRDLSADWRNEEIYLPGTPLEKIAMHPPTGGWKQLGEPGAVKASVPGTTEEYFHRDLDLSKIVKPRSPASPLEGVTWWSRSFKVPDFAGPRRLLLRFGSVRLRAEVFINHQLAGYDLVGTRPSAWTSPTW